MIYLYYAAATVLLAVVDALRMRAKNKPPFAVGNNDISHPVSWGLGIAVAVTLYLILVPVSWRVVLYAAGFTAIRFLLYDPSLNIFVNFLVFPRPLDYVSGRSNSVTESRLNRIPFWWRRAMAAVVLAVVLIIQYVVL